MDNKKFREMVEKHYENQRGLAKLAVNKITEIVKVQKDKRILKDDLYGNEPDPNWIFLDNERILMRLMLMKDKVMVTWEDVNGVPNTSPIDYISSDDILEIAYQLTKIESLNAS